MSPDNPRDRSRPEPVETFEERWSRRAALVVAASGLATAGALLFQGFEAERGLSGQNDAGKLPYREFVEQFLESRMRSANYEADFRTRQISETRNRQLIEDFKRSPVYDKIARDTVRWFEENRRLASVARDDVFEKSELAKYMNVPQLEIKDAAFIANLGNTPEGRLLLGRLSRNHLSQDRSSLVVSYGNVVVHSDCFRKIPMKMITEVDVSRLLEEEQSILLRARWRGSPPNSR
jgi:hypothetical protein